MKTRTVALSTVTLKGAQVALINAPTPPQFIKSKPGRGGKRVSFIEGGYVTNQLNRVFGPLNWSFKVTERGETTRKNDKDAEGEVWVYGELTIHDHQRQLAVVKGQYGQHPIHTKVPIGDAFKAAGTDALKKCASLLGIGLDVYWQQLDQDSQSPAIGSNLTVAAPQTQKRTNAQFFDDGKRYVANCNDPQTLRQLVGKLDDDQNLTDAHKYQLKKLIHAKLGLPPPPQKLAV